MEGLIGRMLELLRAEEGRTPVKHVSIDLTSMIDEIRAPLATTAAAKEVAIESLVPGDLAFEADPVLLRSILHNLLENAVQHGPAGGHIRLTASTQAGSILIAVSNPAPGLTREDLPNLFERLWRKDEARSDGANHGLGLSLSREFARTMGWELTADLGENGELTMTLRGPMRPE
jgi:signal transduction histidine kinase